MFLYLGKIAHRQRLLKSFLYIIIYRIIGNKVVVFSVSCKI